MTNHASLERASYANAVAQSTDGQVRPIPAWVVTGPGFNGIVYTQAIALDKMGEGNDIQLITLYRPVTRKDEE
jgi:hypothetical protein